MKIATKLISLIITLSIIEYTHEAKSPYLVKSRALQQFSTNCVLNKYMYEEFKMGLQYFNASIYMYRDRVAMPGFGEMFKSFYYHSLENVDKIREYIIERGGLVETPGYLFSSSLINKVNYFVNESTLIYNFLSMEKTLNTELLEVHSTADDKKAALEVQCQVISPKYGTNTYTKEDPATQDFLEDFLEDKVERIKKLADLFRKVIRFDAHITTKSGAKVLATNQLGIYQLDRELHSSY